MISASCPRTTVCAQADAYVSWLSQESGRTARCAPESKTGVWTFARPRAATDFARPHRPKTQSLPRGRWPPPQTQPVTARALSPHTRNKASRATCWRARTHRDEFQPAPDIRTRRGRGRRAETQAAGYPFESGSQSSKPHRARLAIGASSSRYQAGEQALYPSGYVRFFTGRFPYREQAVTWLLRDALVGKQGGALYARVCLLVGRRSWGSYLPRR